MSAISKNNIHKIIKKDGEEEADNDYDSMSKQQKDFIINKNKKIVMEGIRTYNYLVIDVYQNLKLYKSLREIEKELNVSFSGISKKLKMSNYCLCTPKKTTDVYYIQNLAE